MCVCYIHLLIWCWMHLASWLNANKEIARVSWSTGRRKKNVFWGRCWALQLFALSLEISYIFFISLCSVTASPYYRHSLWKYIGTKWEKLTGWKDECMLGSEKKKDFIPQMHNFLLSNPLWDYTIVQWSHAIVLNKFLS